MKTRGQDRRFRFDGTTITAVWRRLSWAVSVAISLPLLGAAPVRSAWASREESPTVVRYQLSFDRHDVHADRVESYDNISMQGAEQDASFAHSDQPSLPLVVKWVLLPRETAIESVDAVVVGETRLDGESPPLAVPRAAQEGSDGDRDVPDLPPWDPSRTYPELRVRVVNEGMMRGYRLATIAIWPLSYEASARSL